MNIESEEITGQGIKFFVSTDGREVGRAYLYLLRNDLHDVPFGFMEDVFVDESQRSTGLGTSLVTRVIEEARERGCYKLICTSRYEKPRVHGLYERLGFKGHGKEFRIDF